jgi:group II intron reverse transcriptase/maturase
MRNAETVLSIIRDRGKRRLPLEGLYRLLYNPSLYLLAYSRIYKNRGAMTKGSTGETADGMSLARIDAIIEALRYERYQWRPVRRTHIPKKNGKTRPLGIPTWKDKLLQEVIRLILEAYYEPQFSDHSHGFRPRRGCHTALRQIKRTWDGTKWFIEGDIKGCFDNIDHSILLSILGENIRDNRFLRLIKNLLKAGYMECWKYQPTLSGSPQGGVISPILSNIYLDRFDKYVEQTLLPKYTQGIGRKNNPEYKSIELKIYRRRKAGKFDEVKQLAKLRSRLPSHDVNDPDYRRLRYMRYADDFLLGFAGPKVEAERIKDELKRFLSDKLRLELSEEKTLITHAVSEAARFLGYEIVVHHCDTRKDHKGQRSINGGIGLRLPLDVVKAKCALYMEGGKSIPRTQLINDSDYSIISLYQGEYRGIVQYYLLADNVAWLSRLQWRMQVSLLKTLARKHRTRVKEMKRRYSDRVLTEHGPRKCIAVRYPREGKKPLVARFGGIPLRRQYKADIKDLTTERPAPWRNEIIKRLLADECEICGASEHVEVHHVRKLADVQRKGRREKPPWMQMMSARRRKTLVVCRECHDAIHAGRARRQQAKE